MIGGSFFDAKGSRCSRSDFGLWGRHGSACRAPGESVCQMTGAVV